MKTLIVALAVVALAGPAFAQISGPRMAPREFSQPRPVQAQPHQPTTSGTATTERKQPVRKAKKTRTPR
jgi:hypothetical protein